MGSASHCSFQQIILDIKNLRSCYVLYNEPIWYSVGHDRAEKLIEILNKPEQDRQIRNRFVQSDAIPEWIKDDAIRWYQGKEKDSILSYGIRYLINSKMIQTPIGVFDPQNCDPNTICVAKNDYIKHSIKNTQADDVITLTHTVEGVDDIIILSSTEVSKSGKKIDRLGIHKDGLIRGDQKYYQFAHKIPIEIGSTIRSAFDIKVTDEILFPINNAKRDAFLAWDKTKQYYEVIDKQTGIVLFVKQENRILKSEWTATLVDTNVFTKEIRIQYEDMRIPPWFRSTVKWWTEDKVSDAEYLAGISYLIKNRVMQI